MKKIVLCLLVVFSVACQAKLIDDFESYNLGITRLVASPPWTAVTNTGTTEIFDDGTGNKVLIFGFTEGTRGVFNNNIDPVKDNTTGTVLFFSVYVSNENVNNAFGLTDRNGDSSTNFGFNDFEVQVSFGDYDGINNGKYNIAARNGSNIEADINTWYHVWTIIDQVNDTFDLYVAKDEPVFKNAMLVSYQAPFRNAGGGPVGDLVALLGEGDHVNPRDLFIDNIYMGDLLHMPYGQSVSQQGNGNVADVTLTWKPAVDTEGIFDVNPDIVEEYVFIGTDADNQYFVGKLDDPGTDSAGSEFAISLDYDTVYFWTVVDAVDGRAQSMTMSNTLADVDPNNFIGDTLSFETLPSSVVIIDQPENIIIAESDTAFFNVAVQSVSAESYQWYFNGSILNDDSRIAGSQTAQLSITNAKSSDTGEYSCKIVNATGIVVETDIAVLSIKSMIAYWPFTDGDYANTVDGSPVTLMHGNPEVVDGIVGQAYKFDNTAGEKDMFYCDPNEVSYFDICNSKMTVSCWVNTNSYITWKPMVARYGEGSEGWQLRNYGYNNTMICFTTCGAGNDDGVGSTITVYDGNWHYVAATFDGTEKKLYIDGILNVVDAVSGTIAPTLAPVSIGGKISRTADGLNFDDVPPAIIDEVKIYNYPLDAEAIAREYATITGINICLDYPATDLTGPEGVPDCKVDMLDFAALAAEWLVDNLVTSLD